MSANHERRKRRNAESSSPARKSPRCLTTWLPAVALLILGATGLDARASPIFTIAGATDEIRQVQLAPPTDGAVATATNLGGGDLAVTPDGAVLVAAGDVWRIGLDGRLWRVAGTGRAGFSGEGGPARAARVSATGVASMPDGGFLIADASNHRIRRVWPDETISTVAGSGPLGGYDRDGQPRPGSFGGDGGPAVAARLSEPHGVAVLPDGGFLVADSGNDRIRRVWPDAIITTVAGGGAKDRPPGDTGDGGPAVAALLSAPEAVSSAVDGGFYIADTGRDRVARVTPDGVMSTVAGGRGEDLSRQDGVPATRALVFSPTDVVQGPQGDLFVADSGEGRVRRIGTQGRISTVAGGSFDAAASEGLSDDGESGVGAPFHDLKSLAVTPDGGLVAGADRVRYLAPPVPRRFAVALLARRGRASTSGYRARVVTTMPGRVTVRTRVGREVVSTSASTEARVPTDATITRRVSPGVYTVDVTARSGEAVATNRIRVILGGRLTTQLATRIFDSLDLGYESIVGRVTRCHRFGARRVDCRIEQTDDDVPSDPWRCVSVDAVTLTASGIPQVRSYPCSRRHLFRIRPPWRGGAVLLEVPRRRG